MSSKNLRLYKTFADKKKIMILNWDICKGKTSSIIKFCKECKDIVVYCVPSYGEIDNFMNLWEKHGSPDKTIAVLKARGDIEVTTSGGMHLMKQKVPT